MWELTAELGTGSFILVLGFPLFSSLCVLLFVNLPPWWRTSTVLPMPSGPRQRVVSCIWSDLLHSGGAEDKIGSKLAMSPNLWERNQGNPDEHVHFKNFIFNWLSTHLWYKVWHLQICCMSYFPIAVVKSHDEGNMATFLQNPAWSDPYSFSLFVSVNVWSESVEVILLLLW